MKDWIMQGIRVLDLRRFGPTLRSFMLMGAVAPLAVSCTVVQPAWDDAFFLDRAACFNRTFYSF
jgi:hypothetical protein